MPWRMDGVCSSTKKSKMGCSEMMSAASISAVSDTGCDDMFKPTTVTKHAQETKKMRTSAPPRRSIALSEARLPGARPLL